MKPMVIVALHFLFPKSTWSKGDAGEIILINGDVPRIKVKEPEVGLVETERWAGAGKKLNKQDLYNTTFFLFFIDDASLSQKVSTLPS